MHFSPVLKKRVQHSMDDTAFCCLVYLLILSSLPSRLKCHFLLIKSLHRVMLLLFQAKFAGKKYKSRRGFDTEKNTATSRY